MTRYVRETHSYANGGFEVEGRIIEVLNHSDLHSRVTVLVEKPDAPFVVGSGAALPERVSENTDEKPRKMTFLCNAEKADGELCTREVEEAGDHCWQHEDEE